MAHTRRCHCSRARIGYAKHRITENMQSTRKYTRWSPHEKVALEVAIGASIGGARSLSCMEACGAHVAADPLFTVSYTGVNGGLVIIVADDPGMHSSQTSRIRVFMRAGPCDDAGASDSNGSFRIRQSGVLYMPSVR